MLRGRQVDDVTDLIGCVAYIAGGYEFDLIRCVAYTAGGYEFDLIGCVAYTAGGYEVDLKRGRKDPEGE